MSTILDSRKEITKTLKKNLNIIKLGFDFFGVKVEMTNDDELSFYDENNKLIGTQKYAAYFDMTNAKTVSIITDECQDFIDVSTGERVKMPAGKTEQYVVIEDFDGDSYKAKTEFYDGEYRKFNYEKLCLDHCGQIKHTFMVHPDTINRENQYTRYVLEIFVGKDDNQIKEIALESYNDKDDYTYKTFHVSESDVGVSISKSKISEDTRGLLSTERSLWFATPEFHLWPLFYMTEKYETGVLDDCGKNYRNISYDGIDFSLNGNEVPTTRKFNKKQGLGLAFLIASSPRNKELIEYTINEFDKVLPGVKEFVEYNSVLYRDLINSNSSTLLSSWLSRRASCKNCNFNKSKTLKNVRKYDTQEEL